MASVSDDELRTTYATFMGCKESIRATATQLDVARSTVRRHIRLARERNLDSVAQGGPLAVGERIKGRSSLYGPDGDLKAEWVKTIRDSDTENAVDAIKDAFDDYKGLFPKTPAPKTSNKDLLTVYNIADHHMGLYAWKEETGNDYDLDIGTNILRDSMRQLVEMSPPSETAVILNLGDFFHADNQENRTMRSGHALDVDTRYAKVLRTGVDLLVECVHTALQKHKNVVVRCLPGNHDDHAALALSVALANGFSKEKRVDIDINPGRFWFYRFGRVMLAATHGDKTKLADMPGIMAATNADDWGATEFRYSYSGHIHHQTRLEKHGAICETMPTLAAKDAYSADHGYSSNRAMIAITHHKERGEYLRHTVNVPLSAA